MLSPCWPYVVPVRKSLHTTTVPIVPMYLPMKCVREKEREEREREIVRTYAHVLPKWEINGDTWGQQAGTSIAATC